MIELIGVYQLPIGCVRSQSRERANIGMPTVFAAANPSPGNKQFWRPLILVLDRAQVAMCAYCHRTRQVTSDKALMEISSKVPSV